MGTRARQCKGVKGDGSGCRRPPSRDSEYCLAHDPARVDEHAAISKQGGHMRHDAEGLSLKDEVRQLIRDVRSGEVSPGAGNVMATLYRLLREITTEEAKQAADNAPDSLVESIQSMRAEGNVPDLSEPTGGGGVDDKHATPADTPEPPQDPDAPRFEDYDSADAFLRDSHAHKAKPLSYLSVADRRARFQGGRKSG